MKPMSQRGVALVITLIMVSIITLLAVSFLALSRRDRASIAVSQSDMVARLAAQAAEAHAQAEIMARIIASSNSFGAYPSFIGYSNSFDRAGGLLVSTNVDIAYLPGARLTPNQLVRNTAALRRSARVPVYVKHPVAGGTTTNEDRFYLDFNRSGNYDPSGWNPINGNFYAGDPEWIGVLEHPEAPHSGTNRFAFRYAYLVLPVGNSLDLNYIHNYSQGKLNDTMASDRFSRNQGVGAWEINLAAFLQDLAPDFYPPKTYLYVNNSPLITGFGPTTGGRAFLDAVELLGFRYNYSYAQLSVSQAYNNNVATIFANDFIDSYSRNPVMVPPFRNTTDPDAGLVNTTPWSGSPSPNQFGDMQQLFQLGQASHFTNTLFSAARPPYLNVPEDRYLYYRLLSQLSTGAQPELKGKINLNYSNNPALNTSQTNFLPWVSTNFFKLAGQALLQANMVTNLGTTNFFVGAVAGGVPGLPALTNFSMSVATNFGVTNIEIYPANQYTPQVHQLLQMAANLYDSTSPRIIQGVDYPTIFRPILSRSGNRIYISDWVDVGASPNDLGLVNALVNTNVAFFDPNPNNPNYPRILSGLPLFYGIPWIIGAKKGFPNFNELNIATTIYAERKLQLTRPSPQGKPLATNQMILLGITNSYAVEAWNSYSNTYPINLATPHGVTLTVVMQTSAVLTNISGKQVWPTTGAYNSTFAATTNINVWPGTSAGLRSFLVPLLANVPLLPLSIYTPSRNPPLAIYNLQQDIFDLSARDGLPNLQLYFVMTNSFRYAVKDNFTGRLIDFVTFTNLSAVIDIAGALSGSGTSLPGDTGGTSIYGRYWDTNKANVSAPPNGIINQMSASLGTTPPPDNADPNWASEIGPFQNFVNGSDTSDTAKEAPFAPYRFVVNQMNYEVNDPLVHYTLADITDPNITNNLSYPPLTGVISTTSLSPGSLGSIGALNLHYSPWGSPANKTSSTYHVNPALIDPGVRSSDYWDFPTNKFAGLGWIGRVHRGTPWQTIYLKSQAAFIRDWAFWSGNFFTHPTNDWRLVDLFTTALSDTAATGLLPVNQAGLPAWSAVLSGVVALTNNLGGKFPAVQPMIIQPASVSNPGSPSNSPVAQIVASINATRSAQPGGTFQSIGQILQAPALTDASPFLDFLDSGGALSPLPSSPVTDEVYERIPQQILSLLRLGQPRFVVYSYGQALKPADGSFVLDASLSSIPGAFNMSTNYQIIGEAAYRTVFRLEGNPLRPNVVIESYTPLPPE